MSSVTTYAYLAKEAVIGDVIEVPGVPGFWRVKDIKADGLVVLEKYERA